MAQAKPKLLVVTTGGTIGMVRGDSGVARPPESQDEFHQMLAGVEDRYELSVLPLSNRDSSDALPPDWAEIARSVHAGVDDGFDGFVVTHGTDTLAHSAAAVAFALGPPPHRQPVVFTGAMRTPQDAGYDGQANLEAACRVAAGPLGEVAVVFAGKIFRATRVEKIDAVSLDAFAAPEPHGLGRVDAQVMLHDDAARRSDSHPEPRWPLEAAFAQRVATVALTPGLEPELYAPLIEDDAPCRGVLLRALGAGNVPGRAPSDWVSWIRRATRLDIPVVLTSPFRGGRTDRSGYAASAAALDAGAIALGDLSTPCAEVKLRHSIAAALERGAGVCEFVRNVMAHNFFGELGGTPQSTEPQD